MCLALLRVEAGRPTLPQFPSGMDVPFLSSGAMSRVHYSLIRKVEAASSAQAADQILLSEIQVIQRTLEKPHLSTVRLAGALGSSLNHPWYIESMQGIFNPAAVLCNGSRYNLPRRSELCIPARHKFSGTGPKCTG